MNSDNILDHDLCTQLSKHVFALTNTSQKSLDTKLLKELKSICRKGDDYVAHVYHLVNSRLQMEHSEIRYSCLLIIDELFRRSNKFRNLLLADFRDFLELTVETDPELPLPPPKAAAKTLKLQTLRFVQEWYNQFKDGYKLLALGFNFLKDCKMVNFSDIAAQSVPERRRDDETSRRRELAIQEKLGKVVAEMNEKIPEMESILDQTENTLHLLLPHPDNFFIPGDTDITCSSECTTIESDLSPDEIFRHHGVAKRENFNIQIEIQNGMNSKVEKTKENACLIENLGDLYAQLSTIFQPLIVIWLRIVTKAGNQDKLKQLIDLKGKVENVISKCVDLKIDFTSEISEETKDSDCSDDDFEEVEDKAGFEPIIPQHLRKEYGLDINAPSTSKELPKVDESGWSLKPQAREEILDPTSRIANVHALWNKHSSRQESNWSTSLESNKTVTESGKDQIEDSLNTRKKELLLKAPRKNYDIDLYHWEEEKIQAPETVKFDSLHKFWTPHENENQIRELENVASLRQRIINYTGEFEPVKWNCRTPLPNGKLCPRKDRVKCPFHGPIIARDVNGTPKTQTIPKNESPTIKGEPELPDWQDPELLRDLEAATGVNLRMPVKGKRARRKAANNSEGKLTNIKVCERSSRKRLENKVLNKMSLKRVSEKLDSLDEKRLKDKFGNQWNYSFNT